MHKITLFLLLIVAVSVAVGCDGGDADAQAGTDNDSTVLPAMVTTDVSMLVSDSGVIRYHAIAPMWYRYDDPKNAYWYFPEGIRLQQLDDDMQEAGMLRADTAYNLEKAQQWHLIRNVEASNVRGERFRTQELYWDMKRHTVYSDSFIHIERQHDILEGYGFTSNEGFTEYEVRRTTGIFEMRQQTADADADPTPDDDGEHLAENDEPGTLSPTDTVPARPLTPQEKADAARRRRNGGTRPDQFHFEPRP